MMSSRVELSNMRVMADGHAKKERDSAQFRHFVRIQVQHIAGQRDPTRIRDSQTATSLLPCTILGTTRHTCEIPAHRPIPVCT